MNTTLKEKTTVQPAVAPAKPQPKTQWERILLPVDFSENSRAALRVAVSLAADPEDRITLLHVVEKPSWLSGLDEVPIVKTQQQLAAEAEKRLRSWARQQISPDVLVDTLVRVGHVAEEIILTAELRECDLIVLSEDPMGRFAGAVFGNVASAVRRDAPCTIITVGPSKEKRRRKANVDFKPTELRGI